MLCQAKKEGNKEVCAKLEQVLKIAMEEKQKTLRPEIQLLNNLMAATTVPERERVRPLQQSSLFEQYFTKYFLHCQRKNYSSREKVLCCQQEMCSSQQNCFNVVSRMCAAMSPHQSLSVASMAPCQFAVLYVSVRSM